MFYHTISRSATPCFEILGAPNGTPEFCVEYIQKKIAEARQLLHLLPQLCETQVALSLLRMCGSFCKMAHLARTTPPSTDILECFIQFDRDSLHCLGTSALITLSPSAVKQKILWAGSLLCKKKNPRSGVPNSFCPYFYVTSASNHKSIPR